MPFNVDEVEFLRNLRFSSKEIALILGISRATLYRRLYEERLYSSCTYSDICDQDLDGCIISIKPIHPNDGEHLFAGH